MSLILLRDKQEADEGTCKYRYSSSYPAFWHKLASALRAPCERAGAAAGTGAARVEGGRVVCQLPEAPVYLPVPAYHYPD